MHSNVARALFSAAAALVLLTSRAAAGQPSPVVTETVIAFTTADGTPLEGKLSVPSGVKGRAPVVFHLHGAGPRTYDHAIQYRDDDGQIRVYRYYDFYAQELGRRGLAFFRISKRGVTAEPSGRPIIDRAVFSKATPAVLLDDYAKALEVLRLRPEIDARRIILSGASEGTRLAPELALRSPDGIAGLVLAGYAADNQRDTVVWQNTVGPWRNILRLFPAAADGELTRLEYDAAVARDPQVAARAPFDALDVDASGGITAQEVARVVQPRLDAILKAVADRNDDFIWQAVVNLSSAYLLDGWEGPPHYRTLAKLDVPIAIFHGELDGTTRVEGAREAEAAVRAAGRTNVTLQVYPGHDHDLNWTVAAAARGGPAPFLDMFDLMGKLAAVQ